MEQRRVFYMLLVILLFMACSKEGEEVPESIPLPSEEEYETELINPDYMGINQETTRIINCDPDKGRYTFSSNADTQKLRPGNVLTIDADTIGYIVIVQSVEKNGDNISITATPGSLCDIFANTDFTLTTSDNAKSRAYSQSNVYTPVKVVYLDENGKAQTRAISREGTHITGDLWNWGKDFNGMTFYEDKNSKVYMQEANYGAYIDLTMHLSFGGRTTGELINNAYKQYKSKALAVSATVEGGIYSNFVLRADIAGEVRYQEKEDELCKHNVFRPIRVWFNVSSVPVCVTLSADLYRGASIEAKGEISAYTGVNSSSTVNVGFQWSQGEGISPVKEVTSEDQIIYPTVEGKGSITAKAWIYPRIHVTLYDIIGPSFDIKPYIGSQLSGGFRKTLLDSSNDYCAWTLRNFAGMDVESGLSLMFMNYEVEHLTTRSLNVMEKDLFYSPTDIQVYETSSNEIVKDQPVKVSFEVYDTNYLLGKSSPTILPQIVKFESEGGLSSRYGIANNGIVTVTWTPSADNDMLKAVLYNEEGKVIKKAIWGDNDAVDLGLSVKWAPYNLGASAPEEVGDLFAWAETTPRNPDRYVMSDYTYSDKLPCQYISGTSYDAATVRKGKHWRMPTDEEARELELKCTRKEVIKNGIYGMQFTGPNGNSIFLPYTKSNHYCVVNNKNVYLEKPIGYYWTGDSPASGSGVSAIWFQFDNDYCSFAHGHAGADALNPIRPVWSDSPSLSAGRE